MFEETANAAGITFFDIIVTDFVNAVADGLDAGDNKPDDDPSTVAVDDGDSDDDGGDDVDEGAGAVDLIGDAVAGETLFASPCTGCHCDDASGGCLPGAPRLVGVAIEILSDLRLSESSHLDVGVDNQDAADLVAYLGSL